MKIPLKKGDICPICTRIIKKPNSWVGFHVRYSPEIRILACRQCNWVEKCLRTGLPVPFFTRSPFAPNTFTRAERVIQFMGKFNIFYEKHNKN